MGMQQGGGAKLSTTLSSVFALLLFMGATAFTLLEPADAFGGGSQRTAKITTEDSECCC
jgi:hypothetical protein